MSSSDSVFKTFRIPSQEPSYFEHIKKEHLDRIKFEIDQQVRREANEVIHRLVTDKDKEIESKNKEISRLKELNKEQRIELDRLSQEFVKRPISEPIQSIEDCDGLLPILYRILKYGEKKNIDNNSSANNIIDIIYDWKVFLEEYKWKSNFISNKIRKLLQDTEKKIS